MSTNAEHDQSVAKWRCEACASAVFVVCRLHCDGCGEYHDVCLACADRRARTVAAPVDVREIASTLLGAGGEARLGIIALGAGEVRSADCVRAPQAREAGRSGIGWR